MSSPRDSTNKYLKDSREQKVSSPVFSSSWTNKGLTGRVDAKFSGQEPPVQLVSDLAGQIMGSWSSRKEEKAHLSTGDTQDAIEQPKHSSSSTNNSDQGWQGSSKS